MINIVKNNGIVLVVSLVFLVALTTIASTLMHNAAIDIKIANANQEKMLAVEKAISAIDEVIVLPINQASSANYFTHDKDAYPYQINHHDVNTQASISLMNSQSYHVNCAHSTLPSSINTIHCHHFVVEVNYQYGRYHHQSIIVRAGVSQQVFNEGN